MRAFRQSIINYIVLISTIAVCVLTFELLLRGHNEVIPRNDLERCWIEQSSFAKSHNKLKNYEATTTHDPTLGYINIPNSTLLYRHQYIHPTNGTMFLHTVYADIFNSIGLRGEKEYTRPIPAGKNRIMHFGDSFTYGSEVHYNMNFVYLLENITPNSEMMNFGMFGAGIDDIYLIYQHKAIDYATDAIILHLFTDDIRRITERDGCNKPVVSITDGTITQINYPIPNVKELQQYQVSQPRFFVYDWFSQHIRNWNIQKKIDDKGFRILGATIKTMQKKAPVLATVIVSSEPTADESYLLNRYIALLNELQIPTLNLREQLAQKSAEMGETANYFYSSGGHFTPEGYAEIALILNAWLSNEGYTMRTQIDRFEYSDPDSVLVIDNDDAINYRIRWGFPLHDPLEINNTLPLRPNEIVIRKQFTMKT